MEDDSGTSAAAARNLAHRTSGTIGWTSRTSPARTGITILLTLLAMILVACGQWLLVAQPNVLSLSPDLSSALQPVWPTPGPVLLAIALFLIALPCYTTALRSALPDSSIGVEAMRRGEIARSVWPTMALCFPGLGLQGWVLLQLATTAYAPAYPRWFLLSVVLLVLSLAWNERGRLHRLAARSASQRARLAAEGLVVLALTTLFVCLNAVDLASWFYTGLGDEYAFYGTSTLLARGTDGINLFSQHGAYDVIPWLSSYVEGKMMAVFGINSFGWKMSLTLEAALALVALYFLARTLYGWRVAIVALGMLASSHYLFAYAHTGYPNLEILLPTISSILFFYLGIRSGSWLCLFLCGIGAGLGWYTYYPSRTTIIIVMTTTLFVVPWRDWLKAWTWLLAGFALLWLPMLLVNRNALFDTMLAQTGGGATAEPQANRALLPVWNLGRSILAFNYNTYNGPYVFGSLAEPITAAFFLLGLGYAIGTWRDIRSRLLLSWFVIGTITTGVLSKYDHVSVSRLLYQLPVVALLAAWAFDQMLTLISVYLPIRVRGVAASFAIVALISAVSYLNLHRWYVEMPTHLPSGSEAVLMRTALDSRCRTAKLPALLVADGIGGELGPELDAVGASSSLQLAAYDAPTSWLQTVPLRCVLFRSRTDPQALSILHALLIRWPSSVVIPEQDRTGLTIISVIYPSGSR